MVFPTYGEEQMAVADLHIHSRYSRATSRNLDVENLYVWACKKGLDLVGTGDFTHPAWFDELGRKLEPADNGFYVLKPGIRQAMESHVPPACRRQVQFVLQTEISNIYKAAGKVRKVHNLIYLPSLEHAGVLNSKLSAVGNLVSDGRPILGLDSRDLLEMALDTCEDAWLIPAHIWTPWFSVLGSRSGFDSIEECYRDLSGHIHALETGLSSDPPMNWRVGALDPYLLVSSSDAHSPQRLAREATLLDCEPAYYELTAAMRRGEGIAGTLEFFPEEGKYHLDGHRKCETCLTPSQTRESNGLCPQCGKPVTVGVLHRVEALATRPEGELAPLSRPFSSLFSLDQVIAESLGLAGRNSLRVQALYERLLEAHGTELTILLDVPLEELRTGPGGIVAEAIERVRTGTVHLEAGYDGQFGTVRIFESRRSAAK